jgi:hypothetical protein
METERAPTESTISHSTTPLPLKTLNEMKEGLGGREETWSNGLLWDGREMKVEH